MSVVRRQGIKNTVYTYTGIILGVISTLYIQPFFLTKEQVGITRLVINIATILSSISSLGVTSVILKFFPVFQNSAQKHNGFFTLTLGIPLLGLVLCLSMIGLFSEHLLRFYGENASILNEYRWPIILSTCFSAFVFAFNAYCNAIQKSSLSTLISEVVNRAGFILCILLFFYGYLTQNEYIYSLAGIYFLQLLLLFAVISYFDHSRINPSFFSGNRYTSQIVKFGLISSSIQIAGIGLKFIDVFFVGKYLSMAEVGIYSIAAFIGVVLETPLNAVEKIAAAKIARLYKENALAEIEKIYKLSSKYLMTFCGLLGCILVTCVTPALSLLPDDYSSGAWVSIIICIGAFLNAATGVNYSILTFSSQYRIGAIFYGLLLVFTCTLNMLLIPAYGMMGAAIATASASVIHNLLRFILIKQKLKMQPFTRDSFLLLIVIASSMSVAFFINIDNTVLLIIMRAFLSTLVFLSLLVALRIYSPKQIKSELLSLKKTFF